VLEAPYIGGSLTFRELGVGSALYWRQPYFPERAFERLPAEKGARPRPFGKNKKHMMLLIQTYQLIDTTVP